MTIRDFFRLLIKLFGVYVLVQICFYFIPQTTFGLVYSQDIVISLVGIGILFLISFMTFIALTSKIDFIIDWLKLDQGFDNNIIRIGNFNEHKLFSIALVIIGGFLIIDYMPSFLHHLFSSFKKVAGRSNLNSLFVEDRISYFDWSIAVMNIIIGYLLIRYNNLLSNKLSSLTTTNGIYNDYGEEK